MTATTKATSCPQLCVRRLIRRQMPQNVYLHVQQGRQAGKQAGRPQWYTGYATGAAVAAGAVATAATNCRHPQLPSRTTFSLHPPVAAVAPLTAAHPQQIFLFFCFVELLLLFQRPQRNRTATTTKTTVIYACYFTL